ncbi:MAG: peptide chain release factor N(5)-glutamine methyltransferase [Deltaproteobacteria bacterium]|nr:peptide chain release factor N(5)-glutamine methyltransferase [Deltaproteobacteria bacterium]
MVQEIWNILKMLQWMTSYFQERGIDSARLESELIVAHALQLSRIQLYTKFDLPLSDLELQSIKSLVKRRTAREPLAYILGEKEFYSLSFEVNSSVLIPRPETEVLVEEVLKQLPADSPLHILEVGTGSGCLPITLAKHLPQAQFVTFDLSLAALEVAKRNAHRHQVSDRIQFVQANLFEPSSFLDDRRKSFDLLISNPPYISTEEMKGLAPELSFEPRNALEAGVTGIEYYAALFDLAQLAIKSGGFFIFEIGCAQGSRLIELASKANFSNILLLQDYSGQDRFIKGFID